MDSEELGKVILDGWKCSNLPPDSNNFEHISNCPRGLSQWNRRHNLNLEKLVYDLKEKVEGLYSNDDATTEEVAEALKELSDALNA